MVEAGVDEVADARLTDDRELREVDQLCRVVADDGRSEQPVALAIKDALHDAFFVAEHSPSGAGPVECPPRDDLATGFDRFVLGQAHRRDGRVVKGFTLDFTPVKQVFHVISPEDETRVEEVCTGDLKAVFYVRTFEGNPGHEGPNGTLEELVRTTPGRKLKVTFADGEVIYGTTNGYSPARPGFFLTPIDPEGNNERAYVYTAATTSVETVR